MDRLQIALGLVGALHVGLMFLEMYPWANPKLLQVVSAGKLKPNDALSPDQKAFVADIVKNAGLYNGIVAAALFATAYTGDREVARVLLTGVTIAGLFGAATLSPKAGVQALCGIAGLAAFYFP